MEEKANNIPVGATRPKFVLELFDLADEPNEDPKRVEDSSSSEEDLEPVSDEDVREYSYDIDPERRMEEYPMPWKICNPHKSNETEEVETKNGTVVLSGFTPVDKSDKRKTTMDSSDMGKPPRHRLPSSPEPEKPPRHRLPSSPEPEKKPPRHRLPSSPEPEEKNSKYSLPLLPEEMPSPSPLVDWLSPKISAAHIRRECVVRVPPIRVPTRMLAEEVRSKYGAILLNLDRETYEKYQQKNSQVDEETEQGTGIGNESLNTKDSASAPKYTSPYAAPYVSPYSSPYSSPYENSDGEHVNKKVKRDTVVEERVTETDESSEVEMTSGEGEKELEN